jgi:hypothetical protein
MKPPYLYPRLSRSTDVKGDWTPGVTPALWGMLEDDDDSYDQKSNDQQYQPQIPEYHRPQYQNDQPQYQNDQGYVQQGGTVSILIMILLLSFRLHRFYLTTVAQ